jgi:hypothetical protein
MHAAATVLLLREVLVIRQQLHHLKVIMVGCVIVLAMFLVVAEVALVR